MRGGRLSAPGDVGLSENAAERRIEDVVESEKDEDEVGAFVEFGLERDAFDVDRRVFVARLRDQRPPVFKGRASNSEGNDFNVAILRRERLAQLVDEPVRLRRRLDDGLVADDQHARGGERGVGVNSERRDGYNDE